jgi:hypothetical protein
MAADSNNAHILRRVLGTALAATYRQIDGMPSAAPCRDWAVQIGRFWIGSLHDAIQAEYPTDVVFSRERSRIGMTSKWKRREYTHDICVATAMELAAPIRRSHKICMITEIIWQIESEMKRDASQLAEDIGKLNAGSARNKFLIASTPTSSRSRSSWIEFIRTAMAPISGDLYLALMPTYASNDPQHREWLHRNVGIQLYRRAETGELLSEGVITHQD